MRKKADFSRLEQKKPLCYDPERERFIYFKEIVSGKEKIVPLEKLTHDQIKKLIVKRNRTGPDYTVSTLTGEKRTRDEVVNEIEKESAFGIMTIEAEKDHLSGLLKQIQKMLDTA
jgi:hypothetical protein